MIMQRKSLKKVIGSIFFIFVSFSMFAQSGIVRLGINLSREENNGRYSGYEYEYFQEIAKYTGWQYGYIYGTNDNFEELLDSEAVDIIIDSSKISKKENFFISYDPVISFSCYIFKFQNDSSILFDDLSTLNGKKVLVVKNSIPERKLKEFRERKHLNFQIIYSDSPDTIVKEFVSGKSGADALCAPDYYVRGYKGISSVEEIGDYDYHALLSKNNEKLLADFNQAQRIMGDENPYFQRQLKAKYFEFKNPAILRKSQEDEWIKNHNTINVGYLDDSFPFCYTNNLGKVDGLLPKYLNEMLNKSKIRNLNIKYIPFENYYEAINALKNEKIDIVFPIYSDYYEAEIHNMQKSDNIIDFTVDLIFKGSYDSNYIDHVYANKNYHFYSNYAESYLRNYTYTEYNGSQKISEVLNSPKTAVMIDRISADNLLSQSEFKRYNRIELREKCSLAFGVRRSDVVMLGLINTAINLVDKNYSSNVLNEITYSARKFSMKDFINDNMFLAFFILVCVVAVVLFILIIYIRTINKNKAKLEKSKQQVDEALLIAENANKAKSVFLSNMSHDIRTPMNAIIGFTNLAQHSLDDKEKAEDYLSKIQVSSHYLLNLINDILDMSRIESGKLQLVEKHENLILIANEMKTILQNDIEKNNFDFTIDTSAVKNPNVVCDKLRLKQILLNILGNSIKFTPEKGKISFTILETPSENVGKNIYQFVIEDTGIGMSQEFQKKIFEAFEREANSTISRTQGTGLGMAITKSLVDMMHGTIEIESIKFVGSKFTIKIELPFTKKNLEYTENLSAAAEFLESKIKKYITGETVLLVEDNELNQEIAKSVLEGMGFFVDIAENGAIAVEKVKNSIKAKKYLLLFMDIQMPVLDGYEATKQIRQIDDLYAKKLPIIAMTANAFEEDKKLALECGMNNHISKPIDVLELKNVIFEIINIMQL
ncbi:MAG: ATP-binding protein [Treponema sp.]|nr:ATP-binding protein [Spirochaetia bacterium]MDY2839859.1 ATP-binding protein [Treponema sp.]